MSTVTLDFELEKEALVIRGADNELIRQPLFAGYVRQVRGTTSADGTIEIPTTADDLTTRYQTILSLLTRIGVQLERGSHVSEALNQVEAEERRFALFSREAYEIWHRQIDSDAFRTFVDAVERLCPGRTFYRKQLLSAFHLAFSQNACNFSVPGSGKTSIVYSAYSYLKGLPEPDEKKIDRLLIVGPLSSFKAWEDEYADIFLRKPQSIRITGALAGAARSDHLRGVSTVSREIELTMTSYATLASSEEDFRVYLSRANRRTMMVLDEAHYIKRDDGVWAAAALRLAGLASSRVVLTGTPAPNGYEDLSNLFKFIYPSRHIVGFPAASLKAMTDGTFPRAIPELKEKIRPYYTRIRKADLGLPEASETRVPVALSREHERIYRSLERKIVPQLRQVLSANGNLVRLKARLIRLRQACVNPELLLKPLEDEGVFDTGGTGDYSVGELEIMDSIRGFNATQQLDRLHVCETLVRSLLETQQKVLIWSYFLGNLEKLRVSFRELAPFVEVLSGATPVASSDSEDEELLGTREQIIDQFHETQGRAILIANPQAVGESISLHKACRSAVYFDRDFNAGRFIQSKDRIHRYNPNGGAAVNYYYLSSIGTVDEDIDARLLAKERRLADLVDSEDIPLLTEVGEDDTDDIRAILEAYERRKTQ